MSRPQSRWWRAYDAALENPKVQRLSDKLFRTWFNVLCIACRNGGDLPAPDDVAFLLRLKPEEASRRIADLRNAGLLDDCNGCLKPHDWDTMQFQSDVSTDRVKRFRKRERNVSEAPDETAPETETDTDNPSLRSGPQKPSIVRPARIPGDDPKADLYDLTKQHFGARSGGFTAKFLKAVGSPHEALHLANEAIADAPDTDAAKAFMGRIISDRERGNGSLELTARDRGEAW